jgi:hypothetical protein
VHERQVGHRDQFEAAIENAEDVVALEIELVHIAGDLLVVGRIAEPQVAVVRIQRQEVPANAPAVAGVQRPDRDDARGAGMLLRFHGLNLGVSLDLPKG